MGDASYNAIHSSKNNWKLTFNHRTISLIYNFNKSHINPQFFAEFNTSLLTPTSPRWITSQYITTGLPVLSNSTRLLTCSIHTLTFVPAYRLLLPQILTADILHLSDVCITTTTNIIINTQPTRSIKTVNVLNKTWNILFDKVKLRDIGQILFNG